MASDTLPRPPAIGSAEYRARRAALMASLAPSSAVLLPAATLVTRSNDSEYAFRQDSDFHYLSGFPEPDALLVLVPGRKAGEAVLFCPDKDPAWEAWTGIRVGAEAAVERFGVDQAFPVSQRDERLVELLDGCRTLYLPLHDETAMTLAEDARQWLLARTRQGAQAPQALADVSALIHERRLIKSDAELALMRHAGRVSAQAHVRAMRSVRAGLAEYQLQAELEHEFLWQGARAPAYSTIVGGGTNACVLHYVENDSVLNDGELVLIDAGAEFELYAGDITRTFPINGRFSEAQRAVYDVVLSAQERAVDSVRPGITLDEIHRGVVRDLTRGLIELGLLEGDVDECVEEGSYRRFYLHATSHWLGLDVHDVGSSHHNGQPRLLSPGMVLTVEPGLYIPDDDDIPVALRGIGIRIEDDVAVTATGYEVFTADVPKNIADIEAVMINC